jgi:hypothetical protein
LMQELRHKCIIEYLLSVPEHQSPSPTRSRRHPR